MWLYLIISTVDQGVDVFGVILANLADLTKDISESRGAIMGTAVVRQRGWIISRRDVFLCFM